MNGVIVQFFQIQLNDFGMCIVERNSTHFWIYPKIRPSFSDSSITHAFFHGPLIVGTRMGLAENRAPVNPVVNHYPH